MVLGKQHNILHTNGLSTFFQSFFGDNSRIQVHNTQAGIAQRFFLKNPETAGIVPSVPGFPIFLCPIRWRKERCRKRSPINKNGEKIM